MSKVASDFAVDASVRLLTNKDRRGVVIGNKLSDGNQVVAVEWQDGSLGKVNVNDIEICLTLEQEFEQMKGQVNEKLAEAARLISEAAQLARDNGKELLDQYGQPWESEFDVRTIEHAMEEAGWSTSSWYC